MSEYFIATACSCLLLLLAELVRDASARVGRPSDVRATFLAVLSAIPLVLLIGLRSIAVGPDTRVYVEHFYEVSHGTAGVLSMNYSPLYYVFVCAATWILGGNYTVFLLLEGALVAFFLISAIWHDSEMPWLSLFIFLCFGFVFELVNQYRQFLACAILLFAYRYYEAGRLRTYALWVLIAGGFHPAAMIMMILVVMAGCNLSAAKVLLCFLVMFVVGMSFDAVEALVSRIPYFGAYIGSAFDTEASAATVFNFLFRAGLFFALFSIRDEVIAKYPKLKSAYPIVLLGIMFQAAAVCSTAFGRLPTFAISHFILLVPGAIKGLGRSGGRLVVCVALFGALLGANVTLKDYSAYEYEFVFDSDNRLTG